MQAKNQASAEKQSKKTKLKEAIANLQERIMKKLFTRCPKCNIEFNDKKQIWILLCPNQHFICLECSKNLCDKRCHECKKEIIKYGTQKFKLADTIYSLKQQWQSIKVEFERYLSFQSIAIDANSKYEQFLMKQAISSLQSHSFLLARSSLLSNSLSTAVKYFKQIIEINPLQRQQFLGFGCNDEKYGHYEQHSYAKLIQLHGQNQSPYDLLSLCYSHYTDLDQKQKWYKKMLQANSNNLQLLFGLALVYHNHEQYKQAIKIYEDIFNNKTSLKMTMKAAQMLGFCFMALGCERQANRYAHISLQIQPENIYSNLIYALTIQPTRPLESAQKLKQIAEKYPQYKRAKYHLGVIQMGRLEYTKAILLFNDTIENSDLRYDSTFLKGKCLMEMKQVGASIDFLKKAFQLKKTAECAFLLGIQSSKKKNIEKAAYWFGKCIKLDEKYEQAYEKLCQAYQKQSKWTEAQQIYQSALALYPSKIEFYSKIAKCLINLHYFQKANEWINKRMKQQPFNYELYLQLADVAIAEGHFDIALHYCQLHNKNSLNDLDCYLKMVEVYQKRGDVAGQIKTSFLIMQLQPDDPNNWFKISKIYSNIGKKILQKSVQPLNSIKISDPIIKIQYGTKIPQATIGIKKQKGNQNQDW